MTIKEIREDLKEIRYYYSRKSHLDTMAEKHASHIVMEKMRLYETVINKAPLRLYDLYINLYLEGNSQASLSDKWGYSPENIKYLNDKLCRYLQDALN